LHEHGLIFGLKIGKKMALVGVRGFENPICWGCCASWTMNLKKLKLQWIG
jgi:hypothetical protein